jgi:glucose/arabinose dehydrogenase
MHTRTNYPGKTFLHQQNMSNNRRYLNPQDINIGQGYTIEVFAEGLDSPSSIIFTDDGDLYIASSGYTTGNPTVSKMINGKFEVIADHFYVPLTGITYRNGDIYVSHRGIISILKKDGSRQDILTGLPSFGDYSNSRVAFGADNKMYFGIGTATNSGVVGPDNTWVYNEPDFHDYPGDYILLTGQNFKTNNILVKTAVEEVYTGAYSAYGVPNLPYEVRKGVVKASGSILRANPNGTMLELVAWGFRSSSYLKFDSQDRLFVSNNGYDIRGCRPIANASDEFQLITGGVWYGWPDYSAGEPVNTAKFKSSGGIQPEFLLANHPRIPPKPYATFPPDSTIIGFDFNPYSSFCKAGNIFIAEFGNINPGTYIESTLQYSTAGHKISRIDIDTGEVTTFAMNKSGFSSSITREGGLARPADIAFGPDQAMYVVDMGINAVDNSNQFIPNTGVIWIIRRNI